MLCITMIIMSLQLLQQLTFIFMEPTTAMATYNPGTLANFQGVMGQANNVLQNLRRFTQNTQGLGQRLRSSYVQRQQQQLANVRRDLTSSMVRRASSGQRGYLTRRQIQPQNRQHYPMSYRQPRNMQNSYIYEALPTINQQNTGNDGRNSGGNSGDSNRTFLNGLGGLTAGLAAFGKNIVSKDRNVAVNQAMQQLNATKMGDKMNSGNYTIGQFSDFASQVQQQLYKRRVIIDTIVRQAVVSYKNKLLQNQNNLKKLTSVQQISDQYRQYFLKQQQIKDYVRDPLKFQQQKYRKIGWDKDWTLYEIAQNMIKRRNYVRRLAKADGNFIQIQKLKLQNRFYVGQSLYLSTDTSNLYVKIDQAKEPVKVILFNGKFYQKQQLQGLTEQMKLQIYGMILLYLKHAQIVIDNSQTKQILGKLNQVMLKLIK